MTTPQPGHNPFADREANPYAPPATEAWQGWDGDGGLWRKGRILVVHRRAKFPPLCLKTNLPAETSVTCRLAWHHPMIYLSLFLMPAAYVVLALVLRQTAVLEVPVTQEYADRRQRLRRVEYALAFVGGLMVALGIAIFQQRDDAWILILSGGAVLILYYLLSRRTPVQPVKIDDDYVELKGAHPDYLDRLPVWPYA